MRQTRTERCAQQLVGAQVSVNRAVSELNIRESKAMGRGRAPDDEYTLHCVVTALEDLGRAAAILLSRKGARR